MSFALQVIDDPFMLLSIKTIIRNRTIVWIVLITKMVVTICLDCENRHFSIRIGISKFR